MRDEQDKRNNPRILKICVNKHLWLKDIWFTLLQANLITLSVD